MIAERRRLGFPLTDLWRDVTKAEPAAGMTYKAFRAHVLQVAAAMGNKPPTSPQAEINAEPRGGERGVEEPNPVPPVVSQKERFRLAREARAKEDAQAAATPPQHRGKPDTSMIAGGEIWMQIHGRVRLRELARLNLQLQAGEVSEAEARPILETARREAWSKRLGIRADQLTEEDMNGHW